MASMPDDPKAFTNEVHHMLRRLHPDLNAVVSGESEMLVEGRRLDLENLVRMVAHDPERGREIVEQYLEHMFASESVAATAMPLDVARTRIMPRIQPETIFNHLSRELVAHIPYVNDTVIVFVIDLPNMTVSITTEQMIRWGLTPDDLDVISRQNLEQYAPELNLQFVTTDEGGKAAILSQQDGYDAARLLLSGLYYELAPRLGGNFLVATPARDMFVAISPEPDQFVSRLSQRVAEDYKRLPYPITTKYFLVTRDGVAGTMEEAA